MVEQIRGAQRHSERRPDRLHEVHRGDRINAVVGERVVDVQLLGRHAQRLLQPSDDEVLDVAPRGRWLSGRGPRDDDLVAVAVHRLGREAHRVEAGPGEHAAPRFGGQAGAAVEAQVAVLPGPPAVEQPEREVQEQRAGGEFVEHQHAAVGEQGAGVAHGCAGVAGGVQDVGGQHDVVRAGEALSGRVTFHIEQRGPQVRMGVAEFLAGPAQEQLRHVGEAVFRDRCGAPVQPGEHRGGGAARTGADFQDAHPVAAPDHGFDFGGHDLVERAGAGAAAVDAFHEVEGGTREQHVGGGDPAGEQIGQRPQGPVQQGHVRAVRAFPADRLPAPPCLGLPGRLRVVRVQVAHALLQPAAPGSRHRPVRGHQPGGA